MADTRAPEMRTEPRPTQDHATPDQARQGFRGGPVLYVLVVGLLLCALYLIGMLLWSGNGPSPQTGVQHQGALQLPQLVASLPPPNQAI